MKFVAIIDTDDYKDFKFFEDADGKYLAVKDANAKSDEWIALHFTKAEGLAIPRCEEREKGECPFYSGYSD